jgi:hypothetical protein
VSVIARVLTSKRRAGHSMPLTCTLKLVLAQVALAVLAAAAILGIAFPNQSMLRSMERKPLARPVEPDVIITQTPILYLHHELVDQDQVPYQHKHKIYKSSHSNGDLPFLPPDRSPHSDSWDNSIAICACMFQENLTVVREWLLYHRCAQNIAARDLVFLASGYILLTKFSHVSPA